MKLTEDHGLGTIGKILKKLDEAGQYSYQSVLSLLRCQTECASGTKPLAKEYLNTLKIGDIRTSHLPLAAYDSLAKEGGCAL